MKRSRQRANSLRDGAWRRGQTLIFAGVDLFLLLVGGLSLERTPAKPAEAAVAPSCSACNLSVSRVTSACQSDGSVSWAARVTNSRRGCSVTDVYTAALQYHMPQMPPGQYQTAAEQVGTG